MTRRIAPFSAAALAAFGLLNIWLAFIVARQIFDPEDADGEKVEWSPPLSALPSEDLPSRPVSAYTQTLAHPIFFKSREPFVPPPPPPSPSPPPPAPQPVAIPAPPPPVFVDPGLALAGIMIMGDTRKAYLLKKTDPSGTWLAQGEYVVGWNVHIIDAAGVTLQKDGRILRLQLYPEQ